MESRSAPETAERVLVHLHEAADERRRVTTSGRDLARAVPGISYSTALRALSRLTADGAVRVLRQGSGRWHPTVLEVLRAPDHELAQMYAASSPAA